MTCDLSEKQREQVGTAVYRAEGTKCFVLLENIAVLEENSEDERLKHRSAGHSQCVGHAPVTETGIF